MFLKDCHTYVGKLLYYHTSLFREAIVHDVHVAEG